MLALGIVGSGVWYVYKNSRIKPEGLPKVIAGTAAEPKNIAQDSDGDGLKDWEEQLWGTDPNNPDTDGDGTTDNEEIQLGRNPLKPAPNDALTEASSKTASAINGSSETLTLTDKMARYLLSTYLQEKNLGLAFPDLKNQIVSSLTRELKSYEVFPDKFSKENIIINPQKSRKTIRAYANELGSIISNERNKNQIIKNELETLAEILNRKEALSETETPPAFQKYIQAYENIVNRMQKLSVPENYAPYHLALMNSFFHLAQIDKRLNAFLLDPAAGMKTIYQYNDKSATVAKILNAMKNQLRQDYIIIARKESGYILMQMAEIQ
ncbi:hypothetical protein IIA95_00010 [Patescibacteria group bacterium]|nr:hypothetical protein [Patescibacteria group bacterium]